VRGAPLPRGTPSRGLQATIGRRLEVEREGTAGINPAYLPRVVTAAIKRG